MGRLLERVGRLGREVFLVVRGFFLGGSSSCSIEIGVYIVRIGC